MNKLDLTVSQKCILCTPMNDNKGHLHGLSATSGNRRFSFMTAYFFFFCIVLVTISSAKTSTSAIAVVDLLRSLIALLVVIFGILNVFFIVRRNTITKVNLGVLIFVAIFFSYGLFLGFLNGGLQYFMAAPKLWVYSLIAILFSFSLGSVTNSNALNRFLTKHVILYFLFVLALLLYYGGLIIDIPPYFVYEAGDENALYSQGITSLFMIAALSSMVLILQQDSNFLKQVIGIFLTLVFIFLSLLGAARGDFVFGFILISIILLFRKPISIAIIGLIVCGIFAFSNLDFDNITESFLLFQRLSGITDGDYGLRDVLAMQALELVFQNPWCLLFGGGFGYFQKYYGYDYGMYPHNILLEFVITFGLPVAIITILLFVIGITRIYKEKGSSNLITIIGLYVLMIGLKSGSLIGFMTVGYLAYFTTIGVLSYPQCIKQIYERSDFSNIRLTPMPGLAIKKDENGGV